MKNIVPASKNLASHRWVWARKIRKKTSEGTEPHLFTAFVEEHAGLVH